MSKQKAVRCIDRTTMGKKCRAYVVKGSDYCWVHDPRLSRKRARARSNGGRKRSYEKGENPGAVENVSDIVMGVNATLESAWELDNTAERGRLLATLYGLALKVFEVAALEERICALEEILNTRDERR